MSTSASYFTENVGLLNVKKVSSCILDILSSISSVSMSSAKQCSRKCTLSEWLVTFNWEDRVVRICNGCNVTVVGRYWITR